MSCINFNKIYQCSFSNELIQQIRDLNKLLTLELSCQCNYRCRYCYFMAPKKLMNELNLLEIVNIIDQAQDLCVKTIVIIGGGEPLLYPHIKETIKYILAKNINIVIFTNGVYINREMAKFLGYVPLELTVYQKT